MAELNRIPAEQELHALLGDSGYEAWRTLSREIEARYDMETLWSDGGKRWDFEYKYRRGGKTLCALYAAAQRFGLMIIFGGAERDKLEAIRGELSAETQRVYDEATTYHDGKWAMFPETLEPEEFAILLSIKRRPNRK